jgi:hypothetical protein
VLENCGGSKTGVVWHRQSTLKRDFQEITLKDQILKNKKSECFYESINLDKDDFCFFVNRKYFNVGYSASHFP